ncbi:hypothetical protein DL98DRAFT_526819 [Cadophora sp. DSE1049]|nr:hypothetical protein DL98DRAFT_526819 [Cadophora sp. DSE1049]
MDLALLHPSSQIAATDPSSTAIMEITPADIQRWVDLFRYNEHDVRIAILSHRKDLSAHVSDEGWGWVQWGHEKAGFNKETCEHLPVLKKLSEKEKICKAKGLQLCEWVGDYSRICLEGFLNLNILRRILNDEDIGTVDSTEKWCYIKHNTYHEEQISAWVKRWDVAVSRGNSAYNAVWRAAVKGHKEATVLERAGFHTVPPSSQRAENNAEIRVGFVRLDEDNSASWLEQDSVNRGHPWNSFTSARRHHIQAQLNRLQPTQLIRTLPLQRRPPCSLVPALPPWSQVGMRSFWQRYRGDPVIRLPEFGNAPRVFPLSGEVVTARQERSPVGRPGTIPDTVATPPLTALQHYENQRFSTRRSRRVVERLFRLHMNRGRLAVQREQMERPRSRTHRMEQLFGDAFPQTVSEMMIREVIVANSLKIDESPLEIRHNSNASTEPEWPEMWSKYHLSPEAAQATKNRLSCGRLPKFKL